MWNYNFYWKATFWQENIFVSEGINFIAAYMDKICHNTCSGKNCFLSQYE